MQERSLRPATTAKNGGPLRDSPSLGVEVSNGICCISMSNAARRNALTLSMWTSLAEQVALANNDDSVRVIVLRGEGRLSFTAGADISEFKTLRSTPKQVEHYRKAVERVHQSLGDSGKPTVALIQGICMGGGMEIAGACDLRYASDATRFRMPAGLLGLGYSLDGIARMVDIMGASRAADIFLTARTFDGQEAARIGFVQETFAADAFESATQERIQALAGNAPLTLKAMRMALSHLLGRGAPPSRRQVLDAIRACFVSADYEEGRSAFLEKRKPNFKGK